MARLHLTADQANPASRQALRELDDLLPERMSIEWRGGHPPCVLYEADERGEAEVREIVRSALAELEERAVRGIRLP